MKISMKPAPRSNPQGLPDKPWNIFQDDKCTNTCPTRDHARAAVERLKKRFPDAVVVYTGLTDEQKADYNHPATNRDDEEHEHLFGQPEPTTFRSGVTGGEQRPRGAPDLGATVRELWVSPTGRGSKEHIGVVYQYLSEGFLMECTNEEGKPYIRSLLVKSDSWQIVK